MRGLNSNDIRSGRLACSLLLITSLLLIFHGSFYSRSYAMPTEETEVQALEEAETIKNPEVLTEIIDVAKVTIEEEKIALAAIAKEEKTEPIEEVKKTEYTIPDSFVNPETGNTVSYKGGKTIERSSKITYGKLGLINSLARPDADGFMKLDDRYLIAVGSRFNTVAGQHIDLVLANGLIIKCIMGDAKADCDTDATKTFTYKSRCCSEFIIDSKTIRSDIYERGNASIKYATWDAPVVKVVVYDKYYEV
ncbi:MAG: hypothetical protein IKP29_01940 [Pseudobutyrivibrio sp.]|nr:hypothetical protein [Pseudobutyrivibrio sp.]